MNLPQIPEGYRWRVEREIRDFDGAMYYDAVHVFLEKSSPKLRIFPWQKPELKWSVVARGNELIRKEHPIPEDDVLAISNVLYNRVFGSINADNDPLVGVFYPVKKEEGNDEG